MDDSSPPPRGAATRSHTGACIDCGARYRIPDPDKTYPCRKCGGEVRSSAFEDALEELVECPECGADNEAGLEFCESCGAPLTERAKKGVLSERRAASADLRHAQKRVRTLRSLYSIFGVFALVAFLVLLSVALRTGGDEWRTVEGEELDRTGLWVLTLIQGVVATLLLVAASQIQRRPFVWALLVAALQTLNVGLGVLLGQPNVIAIVLAFVYWSGVAAVAPVARLIEEHPDLVAAKRFRGELKKRDGTVRERHRTQRNWRSVGIVVGVIVAVLGATWFGLRWSKRIPSVDPTLERFAADWRSGGVERAAGHFPPEKRDDAAESAGWGADVRGWAERTPPLGGEIQRDEVSETRVDVVHAFDGGEVRSRWRFDQEERAWHVHALELPLGDFDQRLIETWNEGDLDRVAAFFKSPESARGSLSRLVDRRGWERLPPIADPRIERTSKDRVEIHFDSAEGPVRLLLTRRAVRWTLKSIKPPRRS